MELIRDARIINKTVNRNLKGLLKRDTSRALVVSTDAYIFERGCLVHLNSSWTFFLSAMLHK